MKQQNRKNKEQKTFNDIIKENKTFVISLKGPFDYHKYNNLQNYMCLYEYTPNSIKTVVKYLKGEDCARKVKESIFAD